MQHGYHHAVCELACFRSRKLTSTHEGRGAYELEVIVVDEYVAYKPVVFEWVRRFRHAGAAQL
ncbi:protein of unknown function [Brevefilum fermentans]|uniref:Uncharacterized protein n=1 Tax=Candidatus Brevifilum fermentans TaxID=1986204 RepID=A0A1Y6K619_9CHLR|nr:protein of unknown function [Brevefilum fermentans]